MNLSKLITSASLLFTLLSGCAKDDNAVPDLGTISKPPVVTGILLRDVSANPMGTLGNPNINIGDHHSPMSVPVLSVYPNPHVNVVIVNIHALSDMTARIYMVPAIFDNAPAGIVIANLALFQPLQAIVDRTMSLKAGSNNIGIPTDAFPDGVYRVYVQMGSQLYWDNIIKSKQL